LDLSFSFNYQLEAKECRFTQLHSHTKKKRVKPIITSVLGSQNDDWMMMISFCATSIFSEEKINKTKK
jgi:hypothetical protein